MQPTSVDEYLRKEIRGQRIFQNLNWSTRFIYDMSDHMYGFLIIVVCYLIEL